MRDPGNEVVMTTPKRRILSFVFTVLCIVNFSLKCFLCEGFLTRNFSLTGRSISGSYTRVFTHTLTYKSEKRFYATLKTSNLIYF